MKTRRELANIASMTSTEVTGVLCTFELPSPNRPAPKVYLYKCPRSLADTLKVADLVLVEYEGQQSSQLDRPVTTCLVQEVLLDFDPEDLNLQHRWIFGKVDLSLLRNLQDWENKTADALVQSQRRRARQAMLAEVLDSPVERPQFPLLLTPSMASRTDRAAHETEDNGYAGEEDAVVIE